MGREDCEKPTSQLDARIHREGAKEIGDLLHGRRVNSGWRHQLFGRGGFGLALIRAGLFGRSLFRGCRHFWRRLLTPGILAGACHWSLLRGFSVICRSGFGRESGLGLGNTTPSEHVNPDISETQLLSGRLRSSGRRSNFSRGCSASHYRPRRCPSRKGRLSLFPFPGGSIVGDVVTPAAAAFKCSLGVDNSPDR